MTTLLKTSARVARTLPVRPVPSSASLSSYVVEQEPSVERSSRSPSRYYSQASSSRTGSSNACAHCHATTFSPTMYRQVRNFGGPYAHTISVIDTKHAHSPLPKGPFPRCRSACFHATAHRGQSVTKPPTTVDAAALTRAERTAHAVLVQLPRQQRELRRQSLESGLAKYTYMHPAGTIAGMRKTEKAISSERNALRLSLGPKGDKDQVAVPYFIAPKLHMINTEEAANSKLSAIRPGEVLSFDMEWVSHPHTGMPFKTSLVQLASATDIFVVQIGRMKAVPRELSRILGDHSIIKCGVSIRSDATKFRRDFDLEMCGCLELSSLAKVVDSERWGSRSSLIALRDLCRIYLDRRLDKNKKIQVGRWDLQALDDEQIHYAATDAYVGLEIVHAMCALADQKHTLLTSHTGMFLLPNVVAAFQAVLGEDNTKVFTEAAARLADGVDSESEDSITPNVRSAKEVQTRRHDKMDKEQGQARGGYDAFGPYYGKSDIDMATTADEHGATTTMATTGEISDTSAGDAKKSASIAKALKHRLRLAAQRDHERMIARIATESFSFGRITRPAPAQRGLTNASAKHEEATNDARGLEVKRADAAAEGASGFGTRKFTNANRLDGRKK